MSEDAKSEDAKSSGLKRLVEHAARPRETDTAQLKLALHEIECGRDAIRRGLVQVMLGKIRTTLDEATPLPPEVQAMIACVEALERKMLPTRTFILSRLPRFEARASGPGVPSRPSYAAGGLKYLFPRGKEKEPCFVVAVPMEEYLSFGVDKMGRIKDAERIVLHARPFIHLPARNHKELRRLNAALFEDRAGLGDLLPSFLALYAEIVAFAIEEHPAVLGAHLLARRHPGLARALLAEHSKRTMSVARMLLDELGYRSLTADEAEQQAGLAVTGMTIFHTLERWENHCCKLLLLADFAENFLRTRVEKVGDAGQLVARPSRVPPPE